MINSAEPLNDVTSPKIFSIFELYSIRISSFGIEKKREGLFVDKRFILILDIFEGKKLSSIISLRIAFILNF